MKRSRFTEEQIIGILREREAGAKTGDFCRKHGISSATFYQWKSDLTDFLYQRHRETFAFVRPDPVEALLG